MVLAQYAGSTSNYAWVSSATLLRINCDLSGWAGNVILIRFRVVTNATFTEVWDPNYPNDPHGIYLDNIYVYGESYAKRIEEHYIWTTT